MGWTAALRRGLTVLGLLACLPAAAAEPGASDWASSESGQVRLIAATVAVGSAASVRLGLHLRLESGWKIYWRTPGDAGYPPKIDWSGSVNLGSPIIRWPAPHRFVLSGLQNHGYVGEVVLPLDAPVPVPGKAVAARAAVDFLACAQICVPQHVDLTLDLPTGEALPSAMAHDIDRFNALVPGDGARHGLRLETAEAVGTGNASTLRLTLTATAPLENPDAFVEDAEDIATFDQPRLRLSGDRLGAVIEVPVAPHTLKKPLAGSAMRVTVVDEARSLEAVVVPVPGVEDGGATALLAMMAVALLGGLILNLMPCVLPVLSIKLLGVLGHGGGERGHVRASFLASAAGIVVSFLALAGLAVAV